MAGGAAAAGLTSHRTAGPATVSQPGWGLQRGARADALVVDARCPSVLGLPPERLLDGLVFSSPGRPFRDVMVAGRWVQRAHRHAQGLAIARRFEQAMADLWPAAGATR